MLYRDHDVLLTWTCVDINHLGKYVRWKAALSPWWGISWPRRVHAKYKVVKHLHQMLAVRSTRYASLDTMRHAAGGELFKDQRGGPHTART